MMLLKFLKRTKAFWHMSARFSNI